ncbi:hypothetical protein PENSPDRAFT_758221 [Peniophora sp. CONT]|nr:hypothetical protein PENSPDRAFT_758221 [Peniophora sp. CONT]
MREVTDLTEFPVELLERVFSYLPDRDSRDIGFLVITKVCRLWRSIALCQTSRPFQLRLLPDRAQRDIARRVDELYRPLPIHLIVEEFRLDMTRGHAHEHHWLHTVHFVHLLAKRIRKLHVMLRYHSDRWHGDRIEELLALVLLEPTLEELTLALHIPNVRTRVIELPLITDDLGGRGLRVIKLHGCQLKDQGKWLSAQTSLKEFSAAADTPIWRFISDLPTACLTALHLMLPVQSTPLQRREESIIMPALRDLSLKSTIHDALALVQALQLPSLMSLALDFLPERRFNLRSVTIKPLVDWLSSRFGGTMTSTGIDMSFDLHSVGIYQLIAVVSWDAMTDRAMHNRNLVINFPSLHFRDSTLANQQAEQYGALLALLSETIAGHGTLRVHVDVAKLPYIWGRPVSAHGPLLPLGRSEGSAFELDASWCKVLLQLRSTTCLRLNARAAPALLPLRSGTLPLLEELQVDSEDDGVLAVADEREHQAGSLYLLVRGECDARRGKCVVLLDGVEIEHGAGPEPSEFDDREVGGLVSRAEALHL